MHIKQYVNALGLICPEPLLKTRVALNNIAIGECVEVLTSDVSSVKDFHRLIELTEHTMIVFEKVNNSFYQDNVNQALATRYRYVLQKGQ